MKKRAVELSFNAIIIAALALVVLIVLILIFTGFAEDYSKKYRDVGDQSIKQAEGKKCSGFFTPDRYCSSSGSCGDDRAVGTDFDDCKGTCCERIA